MKKSYHETLEKIINSEFFLVLGTKHYLHDLHNPKSNISIQVKLAKRLNKPVIIIIDNRLSDIEKMKLEEFFVYHNVVKEIEVNMGDLSSSENLAKELKSVILHKGDDDKHGKT